MYPLKLRMIPPPPRPELPPLPREQQRLPTRYWANAQILFCAIRIHDSSQSPPPLVSTQHNLFDFLTLVDKLPVFTRLVDIEVGDLAHDVADHEIFLSSFCLR
jgi:hypothetical protein